MAPILRTFSAENLPDHVNTIQRNFQDKRRKGPVVNLKECQLLEMVQYSCNPPDGGIPQPGVITCEPIVRLFRRQMRRRIDGGNHFMGTGQDSRGRGPKEGDEYKIMIDQIISLDTAHTYY
ncbi:uncharacterized protein N7496_004552 [Penicillium cataractarum]|uniref:Uncharacterized protein n=1 Tax=Penicillium cataractarum TaxID=2100454 RepID=A0A9W9SIY7_9EURO|nr:uncharacterized protein N7496_004552 [Penicillium cataractarum]KAJ5377143.1 hypothetical protein N7496_004552 [Penicillium cataractarum]